MGSSYNIYRVPARNAGLLEKKIKEVSLKRQKSRKIEDYLLTFYFSEGMDGNEVWWYKTYRDFFKDTVPEPKNLFYYGLLKIEKKDSDYTYLVSLGKSHFYLRKIAERDFGVNVAIHIAKEDTLQMKKSRFFSGARRQEIASYVKFEVNDYRAGESVDHLKAKAEDESLWGDKYIIFADSVQMDLELEPPGLIDVIKDIEAALSGGKRISLPKMEKENDETIVGQLDSILVGKLLNEEPSVSVGDFTVFGVEICFSFLNYSYQLYYLDKETSQKTNKLEVGSGLDIEVISHYLSDLPEGFDINNVKVRFFHGDTGKFTQGLKELIDVQINLEGTSYALSGGDWYFFNQAFMRFLSESLKQIPFTRKDDFVESDYLSWRERKDRDIENGTSIDRLVYPEAYFNERQATVHGFELMDRECALIASLKEGAPKYRVEVADLYANKTVYAVKIGGDEKKNLIYNVEQSRDAIVLMKRGEIDTDKEIESACLWFVLKKEIKEIVDINSLQFLLAIESWKQTMRENNISPQIWYSYYRT